MTVRRSGAAAFLAAALVLSVRPAVAQNNASNGSWNPQEILKSEKYVQPPENIVKMVMAPRADISFANPSPDRSWFIRLTGPTRGDINKYGKGHIYLGGLEVDTLANRDRNITQGTATALTLVNPRTGAEKVIEAPKGATVSAPVWSPDGRQIAFLANFDNATYVYVADPATGKASPLVKAPLLATFVTGVEYAADGKSLVAVVVPDARGAKPVYGNNGIADGPVVRHSELGHATPHPIYASLLFDPYEKALLKYYTTGQLALIDIKGKTVKKIGSPRMIRSVDASGDAQYFTVTSMTEPFSYIVPTNQFGSVRELWDATGKVITTLETTPLREGDRGAGGDDPPQGFGRGGASPSDTGKRNIRWNPVGPGLVYLQSQFAAGNRGGNGGNGGARGGAGRGGARGGAQGRGNGAPQPTSVRYMNWLPPFGPGDTKVIYEGGAQLGNIEYSADGRMMFAPDSGTVFAIHVDDMTKRYNLGRGVTLPAGGGGRGGGGGGRGGFGGGGDSTALGGALLTRRSPTGENVVLVSADGKSVAVQGTRTPGAKWYSEAPRPWVDRLDIETGQRTRLMDSPADAYDRFLTALDDNVSAFLYTHESPTTIPDVWLRDAGGAKKITSNVDVGPEVTGAQVKRFQVTRPRDGNRMWVDVTLPRDWKPGTKLPGVIWFYPREYTSQADYERSKYNTNINQFPEVPSLRPASSTKLWVSQGYVLIEPDVPIWGDTGKMNDNYTRDLREDLDAIVDAVTEMGYVDRDRLGIGGHSYGAFSTMNAISLVPWFKGAIAGDGMYNRTLTPFGFQSERRNFYEAEDTYLDMSPFLRADKIVTPILMYHALEDQNTGTAPISSVRMMLAMQGLGKTAALYEYPYEDHSDDTYVTDLDIWARWIAWFDTYVKNAKAPKTIP
ncbi:MAG TPA: prolyl oligopeptidase family serine peptidase [Gemmatimonadaceae bacterium]|nr:prolyl oligopeptidase family serine peptidase [Gemmatimonadaceae bacterium]